MRFEAKAGNRITKTILAWVLAASVTAPGAWGLERLGLSLKSGEAAGIIGSQLAFNIDESLQIDIGTGIQYDGNTLSQLQRDLTTSRFVLAKYYHRHMYIAAGYAYKSTSSDLVLDSGTTFSASRGEHGIPVFLGYESGSRSGFHVFASIGYFLVPGGGGRVFKVGPPTTDSKDQERKTTTSGMSLGLGIGYYFLPWDF